jgi:SPP1 family predicted phage head-tail adaptor
MAMRAGKLDRRILIQTLTETRDGAGQPVKSWSDVGTRWANVAEPTGSEGFGNLQRTARAGRVFTIRRIDGLSPKATRIVFDGETYDVEAIQELGRREGLVLTAYAFEPESGA